MQTTEVLGHLSRMECHRISWQAYHFRTRWFQEKAWMPTSKLEGSHQQGSLFPLWWYTCLPYTPALRPRLPSCWPNVHPQGKGMCSVTLLPSLSLTGVCVCVAIPPLLSTKLVRPQEDRDRMGRDTGHSGGQAELVESWLPVCLWCRMNHCTVLHITSA